jgi:hypothetical protein
LGVRKKSPKKDLTLFIEGIGVVLPIITFRSPVGVFGYYGAWLNPLAQPWVWENYGTDQAKGILGKEEPFLNIVPGNGTFCFASVSYAEATFCVPNYSRHTAMLFDIIMQLRNLNTQPTDLNAAFTVRLAN